MKNNCLLDFIKTVPNQTEMFIDDLKKESIGKEIYLYGCGNHVTAVINVLRRHGFNISAIIDTYKNGEFSNIPVVNFLSFIEKKVDPDKCIIIISAPAHKIEIIDYIKRTDTHNVWNVKTFTVGISAYIDSINEYREYLIKNWNQFEELFDSLEDDLSRKTLESVLKGRVSAEERYFSECYELQQYYPKGVIEFSDNEVIVDVGAYKGDTLQEFIDVCPNYKSIYCFEPQDEFYNELKIIVEKQNKLEKNVVAIKKGVWNETTKLKFSTELGAGGTFLTDTIKAVEKDVCILEVVSIDEEISEPITFIKMDIEGSEMEALEGAKLQIKNNKPKLAISVYHKTEDFLDIWNYIRKLVPEYKFYLRHHVEYEMPDTVLYAVI